MREQPLTDRELRIVRGMMDEYEYRRARGRVLGEWYKDARLLIASVTAAVILGLQVVNLFFR